VRRAATVLLLEPYGSGSHEAWAGGYGASSALDVRVLTLPGRFWKWRMHGAAVTLARRAGLLGDTRATGGSGASDGTPGPRRPALHAADRDVPEREPDVFLVSDMLDVATFLGLVGRGAPAAPLALYMHENQLAYPEPEAEDHWSRSRRRRAARRDEHYAFTNLTSMLAADVVLWNSRHNRDSFLQRLPAFLRRFPDFRETWVVDAVAAKSRVLGVGLDLVGLAAAEPFARSGNRPRILWNHRWEHDKGPDVFFDALEALDERGVDYEVVLLGESFARTPAAFEAGRKRLGARCVHFGFVADRSAYARWLRSCDVVVSTARHEFFGAAVLEAIACGCRPVLPWDHAYPEVIPADLHDRVLYRGFDDLVERLGDALCAPDPSVSERLGAHAWRYDWRAMAPEYDALLLELVSQCRPGRSRDDGRAHAR
jgi:glycosyltransferase involved in cell wall biosynthesis